MLLTILGYDDSVDEMKNIERQQLRSVPRNRKRNIAYKSCIMALVPISVITVAPCDPHQSKRYDYDDSCYDHDDGINYGIEPNIYFFEQNHNYVNDEESSVVVMNYKNVLMKQFPKMKSVNATGPFSALIIIHWSWIY